MWGCHIHPLFNKKSAYFLKDSSEINMLNGSTIGYSCYVTHLSDVQPNTTAPIAQETNTSDVAK